MNDVGARIHNHKHSLISALEDDRISEDEFWQKIQSEGAPLLESDLKSPQHTFVTYLCKIQNSDEHVVVHPGGFADPPTNVLYKIPGTNTCYACYRYNNDVRLHYTFAFNMPLVSWDTASEKEREQIDESFFSAHPDEHNPNEVKLRFRMASLLELASALDESLTRKRQNIRRGTLANIPFKSNVLANERNIRIYTPPGYSTHRGPNRLLVVLDGAEYISLIPTHRILDNLLDDQLIDQVVAIFVDNPTHTSRYLELASNELFLQFITEELLPWVQKHYRVSTDPKDICIAGSSLGGLTSLWLGYRLPHLIGNVISQAPALSDLTRSPGQPVRTLLDQFESSAKLPLRIWLEVGLLENFEKMIDPIRCMKEILETKGYDLDYHEFAGGHDFVLWRGTFARAIGKMLGSTSE